MIVIQVIVPRNLSEEQRELAERLGETLGAGQPRLSAGRRGRLFLPRAQSLRLIRTRGSLLPEQAELVLAELTVLAPNGVEEEHGPGYVEYAIYGGEGELPELGRDRGRGRREPGRGERDRGSR